MAKQTSAKPIPPVCTCSSSMTPPLSSRHGDDNLPSGAMSHLSLTFDPDTLALCAPGGASVLDGPCRAARTARAPPFLLQAGVCETAQL